MKKSVKILTMYVLILLVVLLNVSFAAEESTLKINVTQYPETLTQGKSSNLKGQINSNYKVTSIKGYIKDSSGSIVMSTFDEPNSKSNNILYLNLNQKMAFGKLSSGIYTLEIIAADSSRKIQSWSGKITVEGKVSSNIKIYSKEIDGEKYLSENFQVKEFACNDGSDEIKIDEELVVILQNIRDHFEKDVIINSAYRTKAYNEEIGGASGSKHTLGMAADITIKGVESEEIGKYAETIGVRGIGVYSMDDGNFVHVDTREKKSYWRGHANEREDTFGGDYNSQPYNLKTPAKEDKNSNFVTTKNAITNPNQTLKNGSKGEAVKELQTALNKIMGAGLSVDGDFGNSTKKAVKKFQLKYGLSADGIAGPKTLNKINEI